MDLTEDNIRNEFVKALDALAENCTNSDDIAKKLLENDCKGYISSHLHCPVAKWIFKHIPWEYNKGFCFQIGLGIVRCGDVRVTPPVIITRFIGEFDKWNYKELALDYPNIFSYYYNTI